MIRSVKQTQAADNDITHTAKEEDKLMCIHWETRSPEQLLQTAAYVWCVVVGTRSDYTNSDSQFVLQELIVSASAKFNFKLFHFFCQTK